MTKDADKYRLPIENMLDAFAYHQIVTDDDGKPVDYLFLETNRVFEEMTGLKREKIIGKKVTAVLPGIEKGEFDWIAVYGRVALNGKPARFENFSEPLGRWYEVSAYSDKPGYFATVFRDITERKEAEASLREVTNLYQSIFEKAPFGYQSLDEGGNFLLVNEVWLKTLGYQKDEVIGKWFGDFLAPDYVEAFRERFPLFKEKGQIRSEFQMVNKKGHLQTIEFEGVIGYKDDGSFERTHCVLKDITERKEAEDKIRRRETELAAIYKNAPFIMMLVDSERKVQKINGYGAAFAGKEMEDILGKRGGEALGCLHALDDPEGCGKGPYCADCTIRNTVIDTIETGQAHHQVEASLPFLVDGEEARLHFLLFTEMVSLNAHHMVLVSLLDITERKKAEEKLAEEQSEKELILNNLAEQVALIDPEMRIIWANSKVIERHNLGNVEYKGQKCYEVYHQLSEPCPDCPIVDVFKTGVAGSGIHRSPDGYYWQMTGIPVTDNDGKMIGVLDTALDITELIESKEALQEQSNLLQGMFESIQDGISILNTDLTIREVNQTMENWYGHVAPIVGKKCYEVYQNRTEPCDPCPSIRALEKKTACSDIVPFMGEDEQVGWIELYAYPLLDQEAESVKGVVEFVRDITDRKKAEEEIRTLNKELEQRVKERTINLEALNKELASFAYSISHDFRAPLRALDAFSAGLNEKYGDQFDEKGRHYLSRIRNAALYMSNLIDSLLKLSRITRAEVNPQEIDLSRLAEERIQLLRETEPQRRVVAKIAPGLKARGDRALLRAALENLLENAWKFSAKEVQAEIEVGRTTIDGEEVFFVRDNGVGFNMAYAGKLFGAFQRLHAVDEFPGTGIGLATVQRIINRHGGRIWAESEVDKGATFYFTLPG